MTTDATLKKNPSKGWGKAASRYAELVEDFTAQAANKLRDLTASYVPYTASSTVLDDGCGSGSMTLTLSEAYPSISILATDVAPGMLEQLDKRRPPNVETRQADATDMSTLGPSQGADEQYSHVLSTFMIQFTPNPWACVREMKRLLKPGGVLGLAVWGNIEMSNVLEVAAKQLDPSREFPPIVGTEWPRDEEGVKRSLLEMGFEDVKVVTMGLTIDADLGSVFDYLFDGTHPGMKRLLDQWDKVGRKQEFREEVDSVLAAMPADGGRGAEGIVAVARKP